MKKVLTVLLAIAVMFTFSFGSTIAFAADESYTIDQWDEALQAEKESQLSYVATAKNKAIKEYTDLFNDEKLIAADFTALADEVVAGYSKAALEAAADALVKDIEKAINAAINGELEDTTTHPYPTSDKPDTTDVKAAVTGFEGYDMTTSVGFKAVLEANYTDKLNETQAPLTKALVEGKLAVELTKYNSEDKDYNYTAPDTDAGELIGTVTDGNKYTAADAVQAIIDDAKAAIKAAAKEDEYVDQREGYEEAYAAFKVVFDPIETLDDEAFNNATKPSTLAGSVDAWAAYGYGLAEDLLDDYDNATTVDWSPAIAADLEKFWEENSKNSNDGKLFDVAVANITKVTKAEATAIYNAMTKAITDGKVAVTAYANAKDITDVGTLYEDDANFYKTLKNAMDAADKYAEVVKEGNKLKARYDYGVKQYKDAEVDKVVKAAEEKVYEDLFADDFEDTHATYYIVKAAVDVYDIDETLSWDDQVNKAYEKMMEDAAKTSYAKFREAVDEAAEKLYENGLAKGAVTEEVKYGADKTPEADLVYLKGTYDDSQADDWDEIAEDTIDALNAAQSYDEIDSIMKKAADDFAKLMKADDADDVEDAVEAYSKALKGFIEQNYQLLDKKADYSKAYGAMTTVDADSCPLYAKGVELLSDATTVDGVKAAYAEAQALVTGAKSDKELEDMADAVEDMIKALPVTSKLTVADRDAVKAAYEAYVAYCDVAGADKDDIATTTLVTKYNKVNELLAEEIEDAAEALADKLDEVSNMSDENMAKYLAYKAEVQALVDKGNALTDDIEAVNEDKDDYGFELTAVDLGDDFPKLERAVCTDINCNCEANADYDRFYDVEIANATTLLVLASKTDATEAQIKAAMDAFNALTERQQLDLNESNPYYYDFAKTIADKQGTAVKELKITAKSTAKKGSITVKWTVKGDATGIDGYEIWKSTKQSKGYKKAWTTTKQTYKNSKGLKKGTRYYYKVRAYKMVDGVKLTSDWSNKAYRKAK